MNATVIGISTAVAGAALAVTVSIVGATHGGPLAVSGFEGEAGSSLVTYSATATLWLQAAYIVAATGFAIAALSIVANIARRVVSA